MMKIKGNFNDYQQTLIDKHNWIIDSKKSIETSKVKDLGDYVSHLSNCLVSITPIKNKEPIQLFGLKHKVLTCNKISIYETLIHKQNKSDIKKGNLLLEVIVSDEELAHALMGDSQPRVATITQIENHKLDISNVQSMENSVSLLQKQLVNDVNKAARFFEEALFNLKNELEKGRPSKKALESIIVGLQSHSHNMKANASYSVSELAENLVKDVNSINFELLTTAQKLMFYENSETIDLLGNLEKTQLENFPISYIKGHFNGKERTDYVELMKVVNKTLKSDYIDNIIQNYKPTDSLKAERGELTDASISFKESWGQIKLAHTNNISDKAFFMTISNAKIYNRARNSIGEGKEFLRIYFDTNDLIRLVRGSENSFVQGTIYRYAGQSVPTVKLQEYVEDKINLKQDFSANNLNLLAVTKQIVDILKEGSFKKATKEQLFDLIKTAEKINKKTAEDIIEQGFDSQEKVVDVFQNKLEEQISTTLKGIPNHIIKDTLKIVKK